jgi:hypothetical protein
VARTQCVKALKDLKLGKAPGQDNINPEILETDLDTTARVLLPLYEHIWETEKWQMIGKRGY